MEARLPVSVTLSVALHAGGAAGWLYLNHMSKRTNLRMISNVELLVQTRRTQALAQPQAARKPMPPSTWNFLKMALPAVPKAAAPLEIKAPEAAKKTLMDIPKRLEEEKGRLRKAAGLDRSLDLNRRRTDLAGIDGARMESRRAAALEALPKLEEVGTRRAPKAALELAALAQERGGRLRSLEAALPSARRASDGPLPLAALPEEAAPLARRSALGKVADLLTSEPRPLGLQASPGALPRRFEAQAPALPEKRQEALEIQKKKSVEIEGPLSDRRVTYYELPEFPKWAAERGIVEAEVRIRFYVSPAGEVLPDLRVERTSGYGALDRLALQALKRWRFEPASAGAGNQWGIITFRFLLE